MKDWAAFSIIFDRQKWQIILCVPLFCFFLVCGFFTVSFKFSLFYQISSPASSSGVMEKLWDEKSEKNPSVYSAEERMCTIEVDSRKRRLNKQILVCSVTGSVFGQLRRLSQTQLWESVEEPINGASSRAFACFVICSCVPARSLRARQTLKDVHFCKVIQEIYFLTRVYLH